MMPSEIPHPGKSSDIVLPLIDMTPSDPTCVRSTCSIYFGIYLILPEGIVTPTITFDIQLWWIAYMIIESQPAESLLHQIHFLVI